MELSAHFGTEDHARRLDMVQKSLAPKSVEFSCKKYIIQEYPDILALKIIHEDLI